MNLRIPALILALALPACGGETTPEQPATPPAVVEITTPELHDACCGCTLPDVGHCGNYVMLGGRHLELDWHELGKMDYCAAGKAGAKIEITGATKDGKFVATSYRRVE